MPHDPKKTVPRRETGDARPGSPNALLPALFLVLDCDRPRTGGARYVLEDEVREVVLGRGEVRSHAFEREAGRRTLAVRVADPMMSSTHARVVRGEHGWELEDLGSTNGTRIDGQRVSRALLDDGAVFELGATLFRFREAVEVAAGDQRLLERPIDVPGLQTLLPSYARALAAFGRVALSGVPILLLGESGTGKEVLAQVAHKLSGRAGAFVPVNCGALPDTLVESQLFGHVKGAFSGAVRDEPGFVRSSDRGTLFLDEIGDLPKTSQAALLRVLQEREVTPVGSTRPAKVDLRVVSATHRRIDALQASDGFRSDLFARLAGFTLELPAMRERKEDLGLVIAALLARIAPNAALSAELGRALLRYDWPLNIREIEQCLAVAAVLAQDGVIRLSHLPEATRRAFEAPKPASQRRPDETDETIRAALVEALERTRGNISEVAREMGRTRMQIHRWMKRWTIDPEVYRR
jgi:DNA-binding NtrC family response regulator